MSIRRIPRRNETGTRLRHDDSRVPVTKHPELNLKESKRNDTHRWVVEGEDGDKEDTLKETHHLKKRDESVE